MHPAQAAAIVSALEKVPDTVPVENVDAAERQLVNLARTFTPSQLRDAAQRMRNILDTDGLEPEEKRAYQRESLTLKPADHGVKFGGYLANENAELFRTLIHSGAKPHHTVDGQPDPRARDKRQADALTTLLNTAAAITHTTTPDTTPSTTGTGPTPGTTGTGAPSAAGAGPTPGTTGTGEPGATTDAADSRSGASTLMPTVVPGTTPGVTTTQRAPSTAPPTPPPSPTAPATTGHRSTVPPVTTRRLTTSRLTAGRVTRRSAATFPGTVRRRT